MLKAITEEIYDSLHDCFLEAVGETPLDEEIDYLYSLLIADEYMTYLVSEWGWNDTEAREYAYKIAKENFDEQQL